MTSTRWDFDMEAASRSLTFRHRFKGGITCELAVDLERIAAKAAGPCAASGAPSQSLASSRNTGAGFSRSGNFVADETGLKLTELLQVKPRLWEAWSFEPGRAPVKVEEVSA